MNKERSEEEPAVDSSNDSPVAPPPPEEAAPAPVNTGGKPESDGEATTAPESVEPDPPSIEPKTLPTMGGFPDVTEMGPSVTPGPAVTPAASALPEDKSGFSSEPRPVAASLSAGSDQDDVEFDEDDEYEARKIRLSIARIDTWSTLKLSFLLSVAIGIGIIVATASVWLMLDGMAVFTKIDDLLQSVAGDEAQIEILQYFEFNKVVSLATIVAVVDVIVITLIATLGSVIYNLVSSLIGGLKITLTDE